jgi:hypothetical protein
VIDYMSLQAEFCYPGHLLLLQIFLTTLCSDIGMGDGADDGSLQERGIIPGGHGEPCGANQDIKKYFKNHRLNPAKQVALR